MQNFSGGVFCVFISLYSVNLWSTCVVCLVQGWTLNFDLTLSSAHSSVLCPLLQRSVISRSLPGYFCASIRSPPCHFKAKYIKLIIIRHICHSSGLVFQSPLGSYPKCECPFHLVPLLQCTPFPKKSLMKGGI